MRCKDGVTLHGLNWRMRRVLKIADALFMRFGQELVVTSACDGKHGTWSWHYFGCALDFRTKHFGDAGLVAKVAKELQVALGPQYEVINHGPSYPRGQHIHVEFEHFAPEVRE